MEQQRDTKEIFLEPVWRIGIKKIVNKFYLDMFKCTTVRITIEMEQIGRTHPANDILSVLLCRRLWHNYNLCDKWLEFRLPPRVNSAFRKSESLPQHMSSVSC